MKRKAVRNPAVLAGSALVAAGCGTTMPAPSAGHAAGGDHMQWWREARYGLFVHYGPFTQWYDQHVSKKIQMPTPKTDDADGRMRAYVAGLSATPESVRQWVAMAKSAGMRYIVFTTKHHEGFSLWDSKLNEYNSVRMGPGFDMVAEYVKACREAGLGVGLYYSLWDHHHPDGLRCDYDPDARRRFLDYTQGLLRELMTGYGRIDILWYDGPSPLGYGGSWEAREMNAMVRRLQPGITINDRSLSYEDFTCSEGHIATTQYPDQDWEACMPFHKRLWTWYPTDYDNYYTGRDVVGMLREVTAGTGNLLLNVGPSPAGQVGELEQGRLAEVSRWLPAHAEAVYGHADRVEQLAAYTVDADGKWTRNGNVAYLWLFTWPETGRIVIGNVHSRLARCSIVTNGEPLKFVQTEPDAANKLVSQITIEGLPKECPDTLFKLAILKLEFESYPQ